MTDIRKALASNSIKDLLAEEARKYPPVSHPVPDLLSYDRIVVNSSSGKDSQVSLDEVVRLVDEHSSAAHGGSIEEGRRKIVVAHADLGRAEWPDSRELAEAHAQHYGLRFEAVKRPQGDLLDHALARKMWPSPKQRYCTSDHKRGQVAKIITGLTREVREACPQLKHVQILNVMGMRAEESPGRAKLTPFGPDKRMTNKSRSVDVWLPVHHWTTEQVWERIHNIGTDHHWAYDRGMTRLSCRFCIFAPKSQLILAAKQPENKDLLKEMVRIERLLGHTFKHNESLAAVMEAAERDEAVEADDGAWNM
jgi:3'-phosphoadenosine 5'-phosphosulfate sulfotransferase (PAPS reductase)/FAD synthetase